ncbi:MAG: hypothetical protein RL748_158 [Pseudomonadota bacterium]|jgi:hypothetical protein
MSITVNGVPYSLTHLQTQTYNKVAMENWRKELFHKPVVVMYSCHCFSTGEKAGIPFIPAPGALIMDGSRRRQFDLHRYQHSLILPNVMHDLLHSPHALVWDTGYGNRHYSQLIWSPNRQDATAYYIFMRANKEQASGQQKMIKLVIESAYPIQAPNPYPAQKKMLTMRVWLGKTWEGK